MPVTNVAEDQIQDAAGNLSDVFTITFTVPGHAGSFVVTVPQGTDPVAAASAAIAAKTAEIESIYGI